jgi:hypothetical protein
MCLPGNLPIQAKPHLNDMKWMIKASSIEEAEWIKWSGFQTAAARHLILTTAKIKLLFEVGVDECGGTFRFHGKMFLAVPENNEFIVLIFES